MRGIPFAVPVIYQKVNVLELLEIIGSILIANFVVIARSVVEIAQVMNGDQISVKLWICQYCNGRQIVSASRRLDADPPYDDQNQNHENRQQPASGSANQDYE